MNPFLVLALVVVAAMLGRLSARRRVDRRVRNPALWIGIALALLAANSVIGTATISGSAKRAQRQLDCRADLASPVNDAQARLNASSGRGLAVTGGILLKDPQISQLIQQRLGSSGTTQLRKQIGLMLQASSDIDKANTLRGDPVARCK